MNDTPPLEDFTPQQENLAPLLQQVIANQKHQMHELRRVNTNITVASFLILLCLFALMMPVGCAGCIFMNSLATHGAPTDISVHDY